MIDERVRRIVADHGKLGIDASRLSTDTDLYESGLTSFATVQLMLALEEEFSIEIPDRLLNRRTFQSIGAMSGVVTSLLPATA
ncbi:MAG TPA: acyl carrier protein [Povalibacter sp.]|uniref:acyl carrier protein n=1 Tax=Povalibacter sp. TaxID=1962978 RepID=UPI002BF3CF67|nr:acyl carrier protein [Povalibacter sp.]HMN45923.1 acyl carrier protein [Povalibacter sp.]